MIKLRKLLACLMIVCMAFSLMPLAAFATEGEDGAVGGEPCTHVWQAAGGKHVCSVCSEEAAHSFEEGVCTVCGAEEPADPNAEAANNAPAEPADEEGGAAEETYAAQIGENGYATLAEALAAMQDGDTVTLLKDVEESFTLETNGTIDLNNKTLIGEIIIKADVVFRTGVIAQKSGQATAAVVLINSGSLKLEDTYINAGECGGILVDSAETVSVELAGTVTSSQYGIMQSESSTGTLNVTSNPASGISGTKYGIYIRNGSYTARTTDEDTNDLNVRSNGTAIKIDKGSLSISGDKGSFAGALETAEGVTCSITGGSFTVKPNVDSGYLAVYDESTTSYNVIPGVVVNDVTVKADVTGGYSGDGTASFSCGKDAIDVKKLLEASGITFEDNDTVTITIVPVVNKVAEDGLKYIEYSISPTAEINVKRDGASAANKTIAVTNAMLIGEITVAVKKDATFNIKKIVHIHDDRSKSIYTSGSVASTSTFLDSQLDNNVSFKVTSFSNFAMYAYELVCEVLDDKGTSQGYYESFSAALDAINNYVNMSANWTIKLLQNASVEATQEIINPWKWTIDLAGNTLSTNMFSVASGNGTHSLTIKDSSGTKSGKLTGIGTSATINIGGNCVLTLESGTIEHTSGTAIALKDNKNKKSAQLIMNGGAVNGVTAIYAEQGAAEISSGTIEGGTAINTVGSSITISGGTFDSTTADKEVVAATTGSTTVAISGGSFKHEVPKVQCADGYVPCADAKNPGRFSVEPISEPVARAEDALGVDKGTFSTVQDAINAAGLGGKVTLLRDNGDYATVSRSIVIDGAGCRMKNLTVMSIAGVKIMNLRADTVTVSANAKAELSGENVFTELVNNGALCEIIDGRYLSHTGSGTYAISGGVFGNEVTQDECALVPVTGKLTGTAASLTKYTPALNTDPETKDAYPYTVEVAPAPRITGISNNAYFQKGSSSTLTIYTDGDYDELVKAGTIYRCLHVYNANGTDLISSRYYTVEEDANGYAVITIANSFLRNRPTGTYSVQVDFTTGVTQLEDFRVGTSATPKTGDESNIGLWIGIMACSAIIIGCGVFVLVHKNKKNKK